MGYSGRGDVYASVSGGRQEAVVTAQTINGPVAITTSGGRIPGYLQDPARWPLVKAWDALAAGAHRARPDDAGDAVPPYVERDVDAVLQTRLGQAVERGGLVLLVGESTAGKTRSAHQAVRRCEKLADYRVLAPDTGSDLITAVEVVAVTHVRCVCWLDDLEGYLGPDGLEPGVLAELVRLKVPVLATMRLKHYEAFHPRTAESHSGAPAGPQTVGTGARVLKQTEPVHLQRRWSPDELKRAQASDDLRIIDATTHHGPYGIAEYLAAGPALFAEWRHSVCPGGHPRGAALVSAAVDLARTGLKPPYPLPLITALHHQYLDDDPLLRPEPVGEALDWATRLRYGATSLLLPTTCPDAWSVFDYLPDHTSAPVPAQTWKAALDHAVDTSDRFTIGVHAFGQAPHIAEAAWRPLIPHEPAAAYNLAVLLADTGQTDEAEQLYRQAANAGHTIAISNLAILLHEAGRTDEAEHLYRQALDAGHIEAAHNLAVLLSDTGQVDEAEQLYRQALDAGHTSSAYNLAFLLQEAGRTEEAEQLYRQAVNAGHTEAANSLARLLHKAGQTKEAEQLYRQASSVGHIEAVYNLSSLLAETGRTDEAEQLLRKALGAGQIEAVYNLAFLLTRTGRADEAEQLLRQCANAGNTSATYELAELLSDRGKTDEAERLYRQAAGAGHTSAAYRLALLLHKAGRTDEAERLYRQTEEGDPAKAANVFAHLLAHLFAETERTGGTE
ncbi:tetratricopeptide repeat protein [Streptomyces sp. NPDC007251]|uniref:tetratricopeptide repeat protein n=1 Tax=Streptomyces sp. NPDC007251 TaxID=3154483 RepID=UPI003403A65B